MSKFKKIMSLVLVVAITAGIAITGTVAYLTDSDSDVNVMTLGNVKIEQHEYERAVNADGTYKTDTIDGVPSYVLTDFTQAKPLYPATASTNNGAGSWDSTIVRMTQVDSYGSMQVFENKNAQDKFVTVENTGKTDAYVRTLVAIECGDGNANLIGLGTRCIPADEAAKSTAPWVSNYIDKITVDGNTYSLYEYVYRGASDVNRHVNGVLPAGDTTYPSLCQVYLKSTATNEDCEKLDGNDSGTLDILVLSQAVQVSGFDDAKTALDAGFGATTAENAAKWFADSGLVVATPASGATRPAGYNPVDSATPNVVDGIVVIDKSDDSTNLRALYTGDGKKVSGDLTVTDCYLDGTYAMNVIGDDTGVLTVSDTDLRGWVSYDGFTSASFTDCTFGVNSNPEYYNVVRPYSDVTFTNCEFDGTEFYLDKLPEGAIVTFVNCTMNGEKIESADDIKVTYGDKSDVIVDPVEVSDNNDLAEAIANNTNADITLDEGEYTTNLEVEGGKDITIVGNGKDTVLSGQIATTSSTAGTITLKNLTVKVSNDIKDSTGISQTGKSAIAIWGNQTVICENVTFEMSLEDSTAITSYWDTGVGTSIVVKNCVFNCNGQRPIRATGNVTVENCTFNDPYRYAVQLTAKASTATELDKAIINFNNNTIVNGESGKAFVYGVQLEGVDYGCHDCVINGSGNTIENGGTESTMYYCECGKVVHDTIEWNVEVDPVHKAN